MAVCLLFKRPTLVRGDWKWLKEIFDMRNFWKKSDGICFKCKATKKAGPCQLLWLNIQTLLWKKIYVQFLLRDETMTSSSDPRFSQRSIFESIPRLSTQEFLSCALKLGVFFLLFCDLWNDLVIDVLCPCPGRNTSTLCVLLHISNRLWCASATCILSTWGCACG